MKGVYIWDGLDLAREKEGAGVDSSGLKAVPEVGTMTDSSVMDWTGLDGLESDNCGFVSIPKDWEGLDCRKRLYWRGEYLSKLDSSLLGGGEPNLNVLVWGGAVR